MKTAIVHDWFYTLGGGEKVVKSLVNLYPRSDIFALIDFFEDQNRREILNGKQVKTSFIQKLPTAKSNHRKFLQLFPLAIEQLNVSAYDLVISSSSSVAKGVLSHSEQLHVCYCHSPMRYAWDLYFQYLQEAGLLTGLKSWYARKVLHDVRLWDASNSQRVDHFITNSNYIAKRIEKCYGRSSTVIYPPVAVEDFKLNTNKEDFYLTVSRLVPYKKVDLIVEAFSYMPDKKLVVIGDGPQMHPIKKKASSKNIEILGHQSTECIVDYMQRAKAFVFAAIEDFGIVPVEAQACGTPVIAISRGGVAETVLGKHVNQSLNGADTGVFFKEQNVAALIEAVAFFQAQAYRFDPNQIRMHATKFSTERFECILSNQLQKWYEAFKNP